MNLQQQNVFYKPQKIQKEENCLSSLSCEICKLFPNQNIEIQHQNCVLRSRQDSQNSSNLDKNLSSNINEINYPTTSVTNHGMVTVVTFHRLGKFDVFLPSYLPYL